jgi:ribosomal protein L7Ae-like RNA K-turn-binding protein
MRKLSYVIVAAMLLSTGSILATSTELDEPTAGISEQIHEMLADNSFSEGECNSTAQVRFTLNDKGQIVVLSVETESENLERFVKSKLNYKKIEISNVKEGKLYTVPVRITS